MNKSFVIHPFLFAIFPVLFLYTHNISILSIAQIFIPLAINILFALLLLFLLKIVFKDKHRAGLLVSLFLVWFFSYGHIYNVVSEFITQEESSLALDKLVFFYLSIAFLVGIYFSVKIRSNLHNLTRVLNVASIFLVVISLVNIGLYDLKTRIGRENINAVKVETTIVPNEDTILLPDIYYIILDGYAREDILKEFYQYDNREFINYLTEKGFYVADKSRANYCQTLLSLASSMNFIYLDDLVDTVGVESDDKMPLKNIIKNNRLFSFLRKSGYLIVTFDSGYHFTQIENSDLYVTSRFFLNDFQNIIINTTPLPLVLTMLLPKYNQFNLQRKRILYTFDYLGRLCRFHTPIFAFAHIVAPHPPFIFGPNGEPVDPTRDFRWSDGNHYMMQKGASTDEYIDSYKKQLTFINTKTRVLIDTILSKSNRSVIIILQGDHGPGSQLNWESIEKTNLKERLSIFNAYYLPKGGEKHLYKDITPVNTFRVILNDYFGKHYDLLTDESYFSLLRYPYRFIKVDREALQ